MGDKYKKWDTSVKSCGQSTQSIQSLLGDKWKTSVKSCGQALRASRAYWETSGRQVGDKWETSIKSRGQSTESIQSLLGDKWETRVKSCGQEHKPGDKLKIVRPEHAPL